MCTFPFSQLLRSYPYARPSQIPPIAEPMTPVPEVAAVAVVVAQDTVEPALPLGQTVSTETEDTSINQAHPIPLPDNPIPEGAIPPLGAAQVAQQFALPQGAPAPAPVPVVDEPAIAVDQVNPPPPRLLLSLEGFPSIGFEENDN
jgi:hypothetical protein